MVKVLRYKGFRGISEEDVRGVSASGDLSVCENVDLHDEFNPITRDGYSAAKVAGVFHSLAAFGQICLAVKDGALVRVNPNYSIEEMLAGVGPLRVDYAEVNEVVYFTNPFANGMVVDGRYEAYVEPESVYDEITDESGAGSGIPSPKIKPPKGHMLCYHNGRLYVAVGSIIYYSDSMNLRSFDEEQAIPLGGILRLMRPVSDGIYISDGTGTYFMAGRDADDMALVKLTDANAVPFASTMVEDGSVVVGEDTIRGRAVVWASDEGMCIGADGGVFINLTSRRYRMPSGMADGYAYHRKHAGGLSQVIAGVNTI
jgi:hypothetical protein